MFTDFAAATQVLSAAPCGNPVSRSKTFRRPSPKIRKTDEPSLPGIGHNSDGAGELRDEFRETSVVPSHAEDEAVKFLYIQTHIGDWISGTLGMSTELEGAYIRFLTRLYDRGRAFPDDDRLMSTVMGLSLRVWKRVKEALVDLGKIFIFRGCLTNERFEKERIKRAEMLRKQAEAALKRHAENRAKKQSLPEVSPKFGESLDETSPKLGENVDEKPNEINEKPVTPGGESYNQESNNLNKKKEESPNGDMSSAPDDPSPKKLTASIAAQAAFEAYNAMAKKAGLPVARSLTNDRKRALALRVKDAGGVEEFKKIIDTIPESDFLTGKNERGWVANLGFICQPSSFSKLMDGVYANRQPKKANKHEALYRSLI